MEGPQPEPTDIQRFYKNSTVFLTGATGFIGKLVLEKVLRTLSVKKVYVLIRKKQGISADQRCEDIFESKAFDLLKRSQPDVLQKVSFMKGDCSLPMLGMSQEDQNTFLEEVDVIFHIAATVRFDDPFKKSIFTNVRATRDLVELAQKVQNLKTFVYLSTAFLNCNSTEIKEEVYPAKISAESLITVCENLDDDSLNSIKEKIIDGWPNTNAFSKQVAEDYINRNARDIPICIVRPTIVVSTLDEPVSAYVDNVLSFAGLIMANTLGISRISYYNKKNMDIIPADFVVNQCVATGWQTGQSFKPFVTEVPVYHVSSVMDNPITQDQIFDGCAHHATQVPSEKIFTYPLYFRTTCKQNYLFLRLIFHTLVAYVMDLSLKLRGKTPIFADAVDKLHKFQESYEYFTTRNIFPHVGNTHKILKKMSFKDRELFNFDVTTINWDTYLSHYLKGLRLYLLKDPIESVPAGKKHLNYLRRVFIFSAIIGVIVLYAIGKIFLFRVVPAIFSLVLYLMRGSLC